MPTRKLIEVALPLDDINAASAREKSIRHGHPSTLHLWWARRPLAACRAVLFASLIDDPDQEGVPAELLSEIDALPAPQLPDWQELPLAEQRRQRLFRFIKLLVQWESSNDERVLVTARRLIHAATGGNPPPVYDPFAGGGSIPLEAQRLGLEAHASDLNPVAVLINKALIEIPPKFAGMSPVNPVSRAQSSAAWKGAAGLAADVRYYGKWMRDEAEKRIGHLYPKVKLPKEHGGGEATVIAWLWARTVTCPNPACGATMPLVRSFALSTKKGKEAWVEPMVERSTKHIRFEVRGGSGKEPEGTISRKGARCLVCGTAVPFEYIRLEGRAGRMGTQLLSIVAEGSRQRIHVSASEEQVAIALGANPTWIPDIEMVHNPFSVRPPIYGFGVFSDIFTSRQLVALSLFSELVHEARDLIEKDIAEQYRLDTEQARQYKEAVITYLGLGVSKLTSFHCALGLWRASENKTGRAFGRQALPMVWDFPEVNPFVEAGGELLGTFNSEADLLNRLPAYSFGKVRQLDAVTSNISPGSCISTDPPYYNNVDYADLSDFFYVWLKKILGTTYPDLFGTILTPKSQELVATPYRFEGGKEEAKRFFEEGFSKAFAQMRTAQNPSYPLTVFYAFKQAEADAGDDQDTNVDIDVTASTGWETMLEGLVLAGFIVTGTLPMRTETVGALKTKMGVLATSIVLVCRPRPEDARSTTRLEFIRALRRELPAALRALQRANIAPVDLAQAAIGPGMAIYSRYKAVLEADGSAMRVRTALQLINQALDEVLAEQEGEYDADTRWAIAWFEQSAFDEGQYGVAETLSKAKNTSVAGMVEAGVVVARGGKVRLISRDELPVAWDPAKDARVTAWEATQHLVRALDKGGESGAAAILAALPGSIADQARDLAYRLYTTCERKKWAQEALAYNSLVIAWPEIAKLAVQRGDDGGPMQARMEL